MGVYLKLDASGRPANFSTIRSAIKYIGSHNLVSRRDCSKNGRPDPYKCGVWYLKKRTGLSRQAIRGIAEARKNTGQKDANGTPFRQYAYHIRGYHVVYKAILHYLNTNLRRDPSYATNKDIAEIAKGWNDHDKPPYCSEIFLKHQTAILNSAGGKNAEIAYQGEKSILSKINRVDRPVFQRIIED